MEDLRNRHRRPTVADGTVFRHEPIVVTKDRNYSAYDIKQLLAAIGLGDSIEPFTRLMVPKMDYLEAPMGTMTLHQRRGHQDATAAGVLGRRL